MYTGRMMYFERRLSAHVLLGEWSILTRPSDHENNSHTNFTDNSGRGIQRNKANGIAVGNQSIIAMCSDAPTKILANLNRCNNYIVKYTTILVLGYVCSAYMFLKCVLCDTPSVKFICIDIW